MHTTPHDTRRASRHDEFLRERDLARRWKTSQRTLQRWRAEDRGPKFVRIGGAIRYRLADVVAYEQRGEDDEELQG